MSDFLKQLDEDFHDDPDYQSISREEKVRIVRMLEKMMEMGIGAVYGDEDEDAPDAVVACGRLVKHCQAKCCSFIFALTKDEVNSGLIEYNRPLRCRRYDCRDDCEVWPDVLPSRIDTSKSCRLLIC